MADSYLDHVDIQYSGPETEEVERQLAPGVAEQFKDLPDDAKLTFIRALEGAGFAPASLIALGPRPAPTPAPVAAVDAPATPAEYDTLRHDPNAVSRLDVKQIADLDKETREAFHKSGVPIAHAQGLLSALQSSAVTYAGLTGIVARDYAHNQGELLKRTYGLERAVEMMASAQALFNSLGSVAKTYQFGAHSASSVVTLANIAASLKFKKGSNQGVM
jgi:hypothetical protein